MFQNLLRYSRILAFATLPFAVNTAMADDSASSSTDKTENVVLVHGAWADGSSWRKVIPILQEAGLNVTSVQNRLTSLEDANADVRWALARQQGRTVLVGHSWSGTVVSDLGDQPDVSALVYIAARAPKAGEDFVGLQQTFPNTPVRAGVQNSDGLTTLSKTAFLEDFANGDISKEDALALYAVQQPTAASLFKERTTHTAWEHKPTFYAVSKDDRTISPEFQRFLAQRMNADTVELETGHLPMMSEPEAVARLILKAAGKY